MFLVGTGIPSHITSLPKTVLSTPFGQMLKPQLDRAMREVTQAPVPSQAIPPANRHANTVEVGTSLANVSLNGNHGKHTQFASGVVHNVKRLSEMEALLASAKKTCSVIFFTSSTCPPCKICYPAYDELAMEAGGKAVLIKVDMNQAFDIGTKYPVRATPTFMTFLNGEKMDEWAGADVSRLKSTVRMLIQMAHPPHPHTTLHLSTLQRPHPKPVTYAKVPPLDKLVARLGRDPKDPNITGLTTFIQTRTSSPAASAPLPNLPSIAAFVTASLKSIPADKIFPLIDLLRLTLVDARVSGYFAEEHGHATVLAILSHVNTLGESCPHTLRIVTLQLACNLFTSPLYPPQLLSNPQLCMPLIQLVAASLLDTVHAPVRICAASLAYNIAACNHLQRLDGNDDLLPEEPQVELVASLLEAVGREESKDGLKGLIFALGLIAYACPRDGEVRDLLGVMDAKGLVDGKMGMVADGDEVLLREVKEVVV
jgi:thiol-disulfide isomerase/thioredoxin